VASVFACVGVFFGQLVQSDLPIQISAERSVFQWEIQRLLLEGKAQTNSYNTNEGIRY